MLPKSGVGLRRASCLLHPVFACYLSAPKNLASDLKMLNKTGGLAFRLLTAIQKSGHEAIG